MKEFFSDIFTYHHHFNQQLADLLLANAGKINEKAVPLFSHIINGHQIWNSRILGKKSLGVHDVHPIDVCKALDDQNLADTLEILREFEPGTTIHYLTSGRVQFANSVQEILFHAANHCTHHRGQIIADLRRSGIEPIVTDYIFYKRLTHT